MKRYFADLHVHLGQAGPLGQPVKITASRDLTLAGILDECMAVKGIDMVGVIDAAAPPALADLEALMGAGELAALPGGGLSYRGRVTLVLGCEVELWHPAAPGEPGGPVHLLVYLPGVAEVRRFGRWQAESAGVKNPVLSSQRHRCTAGELLDVVSALAGIVVPAHAFTPFKALLAAAPRVAAVLPPSRWTVVPAVELGLSSDTALAGCLPELAAFTFLSNSDAHSRAKIAREYNVLALKAPSFAELVLALKAEGGRGVTANYGLDPRLGKYHRSWCLQCQRRLEGPPPLLSCPADPAHPLVPGVLDRIARYTGPERADLVALAEAVRCRASELPGGRNRPPYFHQVPLQFVPGVGPTARNKLVQAFGSEMGVLHRAGPADLAAVVGSRLTDRIVAAREGRLTLSAGAGGHYGRVLAD